ncbi:hypothetical protein [Rummeliibacillus pycnus]|uniref:hypothetical protein n=1 Tax=Rummeliibacillus pycnus TaxID=101070 RepID=UPI003D2A9301
MLFLLIVIHLPFYGLAIWGLYEPEEAILFLEKWRYKEEPVFSDKEMKLFKFRNILAIVLMTLIIIVYAV